MTKKTKRAIILLLAIAIIALAYGYYLFNKGPVNVANTTAIEMAADDLYHEFTADPAAATKKYAGKVVAVSGIVESTSKNQQQQMVVLVKTKTAGGFINCTLEEENVQMKNGTAATIKGICAGIGHGDEDLGISGDVYLARCYVLK